MLLKENLNYYTKNYCYNWYIFCHCLSLVHLCSLVVQYGVIDNLIIVIQECDVRECKENIQETVTDILVYNGILDVRHILLRNLSAMRKVRKLPQSF